MQGAVCLFYLIVLNPHVCDQLYISISIIEKNAPMAILWEIDVQ